MSTTTPTSQAYPPMKREDYKAVKHMNKDQLTQYLARIYMRGYTAGLEAGQKSAIPAAPIERGLTVKQKD